MKFLILKKLQHSIYLHAFNIHAVYQELLDKPPSLGIPDMS